jgi:hypothetical protein
MLSPADSQRGSPTEDNAYCKEDLPVLFERCGAINWEMELSWEKKEEAP